MPNQSWRCVALLAAGFEALNRGDGPRALELCDQALAAEQRLGPAAESHLAMDTSVLRAMVAADAEATDDAAVHFLEAASHARAGDVPGRAAYFLGTAAATLAWVDPAAALERGTEGLALARQAGMPGGIAYTLIMLAQVAALDDPDLARALLDEALQLTTTLGYEHPTSLTATVLTAARVADWPTALRAASRALHHHLRSGAVRLSSLAGILNLVARGLAEHRPESAAAVQGAVSTLVRRLVQVEALTTLTPTPTTVAPQPDGIGAFVTTTRRDATQILVATLGDARLRELRARGAAMDEDQACAYTRRHIDEYLATLGEDA
jgi:hypothetical protein